MKIADQNKFVIFSVVIVLIAFMLSRAFINDSRSQIAKQENELERLQLESKVVQLEKEVSSESEPFVKEEQDRWLIEKLTRLTNEMNIGVLSISPSIPEIRKLPSGGQSIKSELRLNLRANFADMVRLIKELETDQKVILIKEISFGPDQPPLLRTSASELAKRIGDTPGTDYRAEIERLDRERPGAIKADVNLTVSVLYFDWKD